jgi:beta-glucosidase
MNRRGPYARGRETRESILQVALEVIGDRGYGATTLKEIAAAVGMTQAGLLHHFGTKETLLIEVLRKRDDVSRTIVGSDGADGQPLLIRLARRNLEIRGLIALFVHLEAAAGDPDHPCHAYFVERDRIVHERIRSDIEHRQTEGTFRADVDPSKIARIMLALSNGLQAQWVIDSSIDLPGALEYLWGQFVTTPGMRMVANAVPPLEKATPADD